MELQRTRIKILGLLSSDSFQVIKLFILDVSKEQLLKNFLKLPLNVNMNAHIFENNEDTLTY